MDENDGYEDHSKEVTAVNRHLWVLIDRLKWAGDYRTSGNEQWSMTTTNDYSQRQVKV
jgi:hypothetical protein